MTPQEEKFNRVVEKISAVLHSSLPPTSGQDAAAEQYVRDMEALLGTYERKVLSVLPNGIQVVGAFDGDVCVAEYHE